MIQRTAKRGGFTITEILVGIVIMAMVLGCLIAMQISAAKASAKTNAHNDGMQAVMSAMDVICDDMSAMIFQQGDDLHISDDCRSMTFLAAKPLGTDLYLVPTERVNYTLEPIGRSGAPYRLIRTDSKGRTAIGGVLLADLRCLLIVGGRRFNRSARLQVTIVGWQQENGKPGFSATQTKPIQIAGRPAFGGKRRKKEGS